MLVADVPLPGPAKRFDYQSFDSTTGRLYISHMRGDRLVVFDTRAQKLIASNEGFPGATGVWAVPELHRVYVSVTGRHEVAVVDDRTLAVVAHVGAVRFPDGIAYAPREQKVFVSDESGGIDLVIDARSNTVAGSYRARRRGRQHALRRGFALHPRRRSDEERARGDRPGQRPNCRALRDVV